MRFWTSFPGSFKTHLCSNMALDVCVFVQSYGWMTVRVFYREVKVSTHKHTSMAEILLGLCVPRGAFGRNFVSNILFSWLASNYVPNIW